MEVRGGGTGKSERGKKMKEVGWGGRGKQWKEGGEVRAGKMVRGCKKRQEQV